MDAYLAGCISGFIQVLIGHPFDTYKVWLQTGQQNIKIKNIYFGIKYPIFVNCIHNSVLFGTNNYLNKYTKNQWISGFLTGIPSSLVCCPMELYKIREQSYRPPPKFKNLMIGYTPTLLRETIAGSLYFGVYYHLHHEKQYSSFFSGGMAGVSSWLVSHPIDTIKTRIQSGSFKTMYEAYQYRGLWDGIYCTLTGAFLVNSVGFCVFEECMKFK